MTANPTLVKMRGIDEESVKQINILHEKLDKLMSRASLGVFNQSVYDEIESIEMQLQELLGDRVDKDLHKYKYLYKFKSTWIGRKFMCVITGEILAIPETIKERDCFYVGEGFIDLGVLDGYYRTRGVKEI